jgi:tRNA nucleotidyltransferase (CCA-adding enzyme)
MKIQINIPTSVNKVKQAAIAAGGRVFLVGGAVVDAIQGKQPKDWDLEVFGLNLNDLERVLGDFGPKMCGTAFGIIKLSADKCSGLDIDVSVPRRDNKTGIGHKGFDVVFDPRMSVSEACKRRDMSWNAMALNLNNFELIDPFGGYNDLVNGILRPTDKTLFVQDPLRLYRAMQLLPRKAKKLAPGFMHLLQSMVPSLAELPQERIHEEFVKLFMKADKPSIGLQLLKDTGAMKVYFPELEALEGCLQNPDYHPEGDVWVHTKCTVDNAAEVKSNVDPEWQLPFMFGTAFHDIGKPISTVTQKQIDEESPRVAELVARSKGKKTAQDFLFTAYGHDQAGMDPMEGFMRKLTNNKKLIARTRTIVGEHMQPFYLQSGDAGEGAWKRLHKKLRLDVLGWVSKCDCCGNLHTKIGDPDLEEVNSQACFDRFGDFGPEPITALIQGRDLIQAGINPGPTMGKALKAAHEAQLDDANLTEEQLITIALEAIGENNACRA